MKNVTIIGAGPAGLTAAYELLKAGEDYSVTIIEESDAIGGISRTVRYNGNRMDIGGHRFFSKDQRVCDWWNDILPAQGSNSFDDELLGRKKALRENGPDPEKEDRVMLVRNRVSRIFYMNRFFDYPIKLKPKLFINMGFVKTMKSGFSYIGSALHKREENSLENFYINRFGKTLYSMFFEGYTEKLWGRHPREISADWGAQRVKGLSVSAVIKDMFSKLIPSKKNKKVETSLIEEFLYPKYGPGQLWETVADEIKKMGGTILMNSSVTGIVRSDEFTVSGVIYESASEKKQLDSDFIISTMPVKDLVADMQWEVPKDVSAIAEGLPYRDFVTVGLLVDKLNLENKTDIKTINNIIPDCWIYVQDTGVKLGRIQVFNNWSPYLVADAMNKVWIGLEYFCNENDAFWNMTDSECVKFAVEELVKMKIIDSPDAVLDSHREKVKKAYPAYFDTYSEIDTLVEYLNTYDNLYCIGRNGQHRYNNMDHSMATAFEAVKNIRSGEKDKSNIWGVNTEKEYHEEKDAN